MFSSGPILWLQQFSAPWFDALMRFISWIGEPWFYISAVLVLAFGVRLRPGLGVMLAMLLVTFATEGFKQGFGLPRPSEVDARVLNEGERGHHLVADGGAEGFWGLPSEAAIVAKRTVGEPSFGFVSGHTSAATAFALALPLLFGMRKRWMWAVVVAWPLLMGLSRMALGRHFLADVLGGLVVGAACALAAGWLMRQMRAPRPAARRTWAAALAATGVAALTAWWLPWIDPGMAGQMAGTLLAIGALTHFGWPEEAAPMGQRAGRALLALGVGYAAIWLLETAYTATGWPDRHAGAYFFAAAGIAAAVLATAALARGLGLYRPPVQAAAGADAGLRDR